MMQKRSNNFLVQGSILAVASLITRIIGVLYKIPLTRMVGSEGMAYYNAAHEVYSIVLILSSLSIPLALSKLISAREQKREYRNAGRVFRIALIFASCTGGLAGIVIFFGAEYFAGLTGYPSAKYPLQILAPTLFVVAILGVFRGFFQGKRTMVPTAVSQVIEQVVNAVISILAGYLLMKSVAGTGKEAAFGAAGGTLGVLIGAVAGAFFLLFVFRMNRDYIRKRTMQDSYSPRESSAEIFKAICMTLFPIILSQTVYQISGLIDISIFGNFMDKQGISESESAVLLEPYSNKYRQLTNLPIAIAAALSSAIVPSLTASYQNNRVHEIREKIASSIKLNMLVAIPSAVGMAVLGPQIIQWLYNDTSAISGNLMRLGSIAIVFFAYSTMTNGILQGLNRLRTPVVHAAISLAIHIGLLFVMLNFLKLNIYALVIGNFSFALFICILNWITIKNLAGYRQEILKTFLLPSLAAAVMGIITQLVYSGLYQLISSNTISTIISLLIAIPLYFVLILLLRIVDETELLTFPLGGRLVRLCKKVHLLKK